MDDEQLCALNEYNAEEVSRMIPVIVYLCTVCFLGTIGNSVSLYIYARHYENSTTRSIFIYLTSIELFSSIYVMPVEIYMLFANYIMFENELCKSISFLDIVQVELSTTILLLIAVDRYRKVCHPFSWQVTQRMSKFVCFLICFISCLISVPCIQLFSTHSSTRTFVDPVETDCFRTSGRLLYNITIHECIANPDKDYMTLRTGYAIYWLCVSVLITSALAMIYWRILAQIRRQNVKLGRTSTRKSTRTAERTSVIEGGRTSEMQSQDIVTKFEPSTIEKYLTPSGGSNSESNINDDAKQEDKNDQRPQSSAYCDTISKLSQNEIRRRSATVTEPVREGTEIQNKTAGIIISVSQFEEPGMLTNRDENAFNENGKNKVSSSENKSTLDIDSTTNSKDKTEHVKKLEAIEKLTNVEDGKMKDTSSVLCHDSFGKSERSPLSKSTSTDHAVKLLAERDRRGKDVAERVKPALKPSKANTQSRSRTRRVTLTMFIITLSTIVCFTPYFVLGLFRAASPHFIESASESQRVVFVYCRRSFYLKSVINPLIYGIFDSRFNAALRKILFRIRCRPKVV